MNTPDAKALLADSEVLFTADEETTGANLAWLLDKHRPLLDAAFALNGDGGYVDLLPDGRPESFVIQTAEKVYASFFEKPIPLAEVLVAHVERPSQLQELWRSY